MARSGAFTFITFGGTSLLNGFVGLALRFSTDLNLTEDIIKAIVKIAGVIVGAGVHIGTYVIRCKLNSKKVENFEIIVQGIQGGLEGFLQATVQIGRNQSKDYFGIELSNEKNFEDYDQPIPQKSLISKFFGVSNKTQLIDPKSIRYSQTTVNFQSRNGYTKSNEDGTTSKIVTNFLDLVTSMDVVGYKGEAINVVKMKDGLYTSMDNRRVLAADLTSNMVEAIVHNYDDIFKDKMTWGEAILERISEQNSEEFKRGNGSYDRPAVVVSDKNYDALVGMLLTVANIVTEIFIVLEN
jgi:hypothetical protein